MQTSVTMVGRSGLKKDEFAETGLFNFNLLLGVIYFFHMPDFEVFEEIAA